MKSKVKVIIFGTSLGAEKVLRLIDLDKVSIIGYLDNAKSKQGRYYNNVKIISPDNLFLYEFDYIILGSVSYRKEMKDQLLTLGINRGKVVELLLSKRPSPSSKRLMKQTYEENTIYKNILKKDYLPYFFRDYAICTMYQKVINRNVLLYNYVDYLLKGIDYVRISTVELLSREIKDRNIKGEIAELGVYQGDFSKFISDLFPDRKLYLFDTFEGFSEKDINLEQDNNFSQARKGHLGDTNIELVLNKIARKENIIIKKGYFPETTEGLEEEVFAFVSIDVDLYKPTYEGLCYFYERLSKGGYILIHDYNFDYYKGVKQAVRDFADEYGVTFIPVSDYHGSAIITK